MSDYKPKVGDIVNVTLRDARVIEVNDRDWGTMGYMVTVNGIDNGQSRDFYVSRPGGAGVTTVELVKAAEPPAPKWPTTPGSIIGYKHGDSKYVRLLDGWRSVGYSKERTWQDSDFNSDYEVLFDAGAPR